MEICIMIKIKYLLGISPCLYGLFFSIEHLYIESGLGCVNSKSTDS